MKEASIPPLRVDPALRRAAEDVLEEGETLSAFVLQSLQLNIARRRANREFLARGLAALARVQGGAPTIDAEEALRELDERIDRAEVSRR